MDGDREQEEGPAKGLIKMWSGEEDCQKPREKRDSVRRHV